MTPKQIAELETPLTDAADNSWVKGGRYQQREREMLLQLRRHEQDRAALMEDAGELLSFLSKVVGDSDVYEVQIKATDIGAAGMQDRLNALQQTLAAVREREAKRGR